MFKIKYFEPDDNRNHHWKQGDKVICIDNMGHRENLTEGKEYQIMNIYREYGADEIKVISDTGSLIGVFSTRFSTKKLNRKLKLQKLNG
jgi:hypothetical protein